MNIRLATDHDFESIFDIWIAGIGTSFDTSAVDAHHLKSAFLANFSSRRGAFNYWVAVDENDRVLGWQSLSKATVNPLKEHLFAESSTYIRKEAAQLGLGELLVNFAIQEASKSSLEYIVAFIAETNAGARRLAAITGWTEVGVLPPTTRGAQQRPKLIAVRPL